MERDRLNGQQEQAMMSTAEKNTLATHKECHNKERCLSKKSTSTTICNKEIKGPWARKTYLKSMVKSDKWCCAYPLTFMQSTPGCR